MQVRGEAEQLCWEENTDGEERGGTGAKAVCVYVWGATFRWDFIGFLICFNVFWFEVWSD